MSVVKWTRSYTWSATAFSCDALFWVQGTLGQKRMIYCVNYFIILSDFGAGLSQSFDPFKSCVRIKVYRKNNSIWAWTQTVWSRNFRQSNLRCSFAKTCSQKRLSDIKASNNWRGIERKKTTNLACNPRPVITVMVHFTFTSVYIMTHLVTAFRTEGSVGGAGETGQFFITLYLLNC